MYSSDRTAPILDRAVTDRAFVVRAWRNGLKSFALSIGLIALFVAISSAQQASNPPSDTSPATSPSSASPPSPAAASATSSSPFAPRSAAASVEERLRKLEEMNQNLLEQNQRMSEKYDKLSNDYSTIKKKLDEREALEKKRERPIHPQRRTGVESTRIGDPPPSRDDWTLPTKPYSLISPRSFYVNYDRGFKIADDDDEFELRLRNLTQLDTRIFNSTAEGEIADGFYIPRQRWYFEGHMTRPLEFEASMTRDFGAFNVLNLYLNYREDDRFQVRFGRFRTPFTYEFSELSAYDLIAPERSLFANNFSGLRQVGLMAHGEFPHRSFVYKIGIFDGPRNSYGDYNNSKDVMGLFEARPFRLLASDSKQKPWTDFSVGGSFDVGQQDNPVFPGELQTSAIPSTSGVRFLNLNASPTFLVFGNNVVEKGLRSLGALHATYYYKNIQFLAEWEHGFQSMSTIGDPYNTRIPLGGWFAQGSYFITGETFERRGLVVPLKPYLPFSKSQRGPGAIELHTRYSALNMGKQVFTAGLADPNLWSDSAYIVDTGINWYWNQFFKVYFDWQYAGFGSPVTFRAGPGQKNINMFWIRCQFFF
jgi:phosphate-selective porin OprO/OprP